MTEDQTTFDLTTAQGARGYIAYFERDIWPAGPIDYVHTSGGKKIYLAQMTDDEAIQVAHMLYDMQLEAEKQMSGGLH